MTLAMRLTRIAAGLVFSARRGRAEPAERRAAWFARPYPEPARIPKRLERLCRIETTTRVGRPVITLTPRDREPAVELVYLHGGAYVNPLLGAHWAIVEQLVRRLDARVTVPLYGLAPWHTVDDALPLLREVYAEVDARASGSGLAAPSVSPGASGSGRRAPVVLAGDSAGGGLALALAIDLRDRAALAAAAGTAGPGSGGGGAAPDALLLISPWVDVRLENPAIPPLEARDRMLGVGTLRLAGELWRGSRAADDPLVSPITDTLAGLPPIRAVVGGKELLVPDVSAFTRRARAAGTDAQLRIYPDGFHDFVGATFTPEARDALAWFASAVPRD